MRKGDMQWGEREMRDYRQSPSFWPFKADWFSSVKFVSCSKSIKWILWDSFSHWAVIAVIVKLQGIFITSKRKPNLEGFVCSFLSITGLGSLSQFAPKCSFWQVSLLDIVLSEYPDKSRFLQQRLKHPD